MAARPGDIFLEHDGTWQDRMIQFGQRLRRDKLSSHWNHVGIVVSDTDVVEATPSGIHRDLYAAPGRGEMLIVPVEPEATRIKVVEFALSRVGRKYNWVEIACMALTLLTGTRLRFGWASEYICSSLAASALQFGGVDMGDPDYALPADLDQPSFTALP